MNNTVSLTIAARPPIPTWSPWYIMCYLHGAGAVTSGGVTNSKLITKCCITESVMEDVHQMLIGRFKLEQLIS